ncbi:unnamed protein product [Caenorhabditis angaria]|uniref:Protein-tyrosine-phosphatase n=1 Tax=Caenorhabditis angaria TaxID=860376 RepID=A0A9P1IAK3_9PELO|nr:unnamed protein product [Caenorhabditis angaria]
MLISCWLQESLFLNNIIFVLINLCNFVVFLTCSVPTTTPQVRKSRKQAQLKTTEVIVKSTPTKQEKISKKEVEEREKEKEKEKNEEGEKKNDKKEKENVKKEEKEKGKEKEEAKEAKEVKTSVLTDPRRDWVLKNAKTTCGQLSKTHQEKIKGYQPKDVTYKAFEAHVELNRYADVFCIDQTRVVLKNRDNDYIHASWITIPDSNTKYILTQGPLLETVADFWAMCYQEKAKFILMLCPLVEGDAEKCSVYFPDAKGKTVKYGKLDVTITGTKPEPIEGVIWTVINIVDENETFEINHIYVPWWPDQLAPEDPKPMLKLYNWVKKVNPENTPIVVHCSAGVGRSATFIGIDYANARIKQDSEIAMIDIVKELRNMRYQAIQSHVQFLFLHVCLFEYFVQEHCVDRDSVVKTFMDQYQKHAKRKLKKREDENKQVKTAQTNE